MAGTSDPQFPTRRRFLPCRPGPHAFGDEAAHLRAADIQGSDDIRFLA
jgi:hypothetical protein